MVTDNTLYTLTARSPANGIKKVSLNLISRFQVIQCNAALSWCGAPRDNYFHSVLHLWKFLTVCCTFENMSQCVAQLKVCHRVLHVWKFVAARVLHVWKFLAVCCTFESLSQGVARLKGFRRVLHIWNIFKGCAAHLKYCEGVCCTFEILWRGVLHIWNILKGCVANVKYYEGVCCKCELFWRGCCTFEIFFAQCPSEPPYLPLMILFNLKK